MSSPLHNFFLRNKLSVRPLSIRGQKGQVHGGLCSFFWAFGGCGSRHVSSHPPWAAGIQEDLVPSSLLTQFPGLDSGQDRDADFRHPICGLRPALLPVHPVLCVFHKLVHEPHQLLLCDGLTSKLLLQFGAAFFKRADTHKARHIHHSA